MRYCSNDDCERRGSCLRYELGGRFRYAANHKVGWNRTKLAGFWVAYRNAAEARACTQFIDIRERELTNNFQHPKKHLSC